MVAGALVNHDGRPLEDSAGDEIREGVTVRDVMFGQGIATGTIPIAHGLGVNVTIKCLGVSDDDRPPSRSAEDLTVVYFRSAGSFHTGAAFESGEVHRARGVNDAAAAAAREKCRNKGPASLKVSNYAFGPDARYNSWVLLEGA